MISLSNFTNDLLSNMDGSSYLFRENQLLLQLRNRRRLLLIRHLMKTEGQATYICLERNRLKGRNTTELIDKRDLSLHSKKKR